MTAETQITLTIVQAVSLMSGIITAVVTVVGVYWRLNIKISRNMQEIKDNDRAVRYDIENKFATLALERKNCNNEHSHKIDRLEMLLLDNKEKQDAMVHTLNAATEHLSKLTQAFEKHLTYHETIEKLNK